MVFAAWRQDEIQWLDSAGWERDSIIRGKHPIDRGAARPLGNRPKIDSRGSRQ